MSTGNILYLIMCIAAFTAFAVVLAYYSWQQSRMDRSHISAPEQASPVHTDTHAEAA